MGPDNFVKVQLRLASHPTVLALGHCVDHVFTLLLRISRETRNDGTLHADFLTPTILRKRFGIGQDLLDSYLNRGIEGVLSGGLVEKIDDETARIVDWHEHYPIPAKTSTERSRAFRSRTKAPATNATNATNATFHETRDGCSNDATGIRGEEIRGEERRLEEKRTTLPPYPPPVGDNPTLVGSPCEPTRVEVDEDARGVAEELARDVAEVHEHWIAKTRSTEGARTRAREPKSAASKVRRRCIEQRMKAGYSVALLKAAIDEACSSPFHAGQNDRRTTYLELEKHILHATKLDGWIELAERRSTGGNGNRRIWVEPEYVDPTKTELERIRRNDHEVDRIKRGEI